jgi:uncharacterized protein YndB with AHSA1/START domain
MSDLIDGQGEVLDAHTVRFERILPGPIETVWAYLTQSEKRREWFAAGEMDLRVGGAVELRFKHNELSSIPEPVPERFKAIENGHVVHGTITQCDPPRLLAFTWGNKPGDSEVVFELRPQGNDVVLVLTHRKLRDRTEMVSVAGGWHAHLGMLVARTNNREAGPFWSRLVRIDADYQKKIPR